MPSHRKSQPADGQPLPSKDMPPFPENFGPIFFQNQFRTKIELPTKSKYPNVKGQCAIISGSNTGLGFEAAHQLLTLGLSHLIMAVRSTTRGEAAANKLRAASPSAKIDVWHLDMESYDSIQTFARKCADLPTRIDMVILNAGVARRNQPCHRARTDHPGQPHQHTAADHSVTPDPVFVQAQVGGGRRQWPQSASASSSPHTCQLRHSASSQISEQGPTSAPAQL